jgi:hypothetical protein
MMASLLYGVRPRDPAVFLIVPLLLFVIAEPAIFSPARDESEPVKKSALHPFSQVHSISGNALMRSLT